MNPRNPSLLPLVLGGLLLSVPAAHAQSPASTLTAAVRGLVTAPGAEDVACAGAVSLTTTQVNPTDVVVAVDARGLSCTGVTSAASYANTGFATLTRSLAPQDVIQTTFAIYRDAPGGFLAARTALLTLRLTFNVATGTLQGGTGSIENL